MLAQRLPMLLPKIVILPTLRVSSSPRACRGCRGPRSAVAQERAVAVAVVQQVEGRQVEAELPDQVRQRHCFEFGAAVPVSVQDGLVGFECGEWERKKPSVFLPFLLSSSELMGDKR